MSCIRHYRECVYYYDAKSGMACIAGLKLSCTIRGDSYRGPEHVIQVLICAAETDLNHRPCNCHQIQQTCDVCNLDQMIKDYNCTNQEYEVFARELELEYDKYEKRNRHAEAYGMSKKRAMTLGSKKKSHKTYQDPDGPPTPQVHKGLPSTRQHAPLRANLPTLSSDFSLRQAARDNGE